MPIEIMDDHKALVCECGSVNFALLKSGKVECNQCGVSSASWLTTPISPDVEGDVRHSRIARIDELAKARRELMEVAEHIEYLTRRVPEVATIIPEPEEQRVLRNIRCAVKQAIKVHG